ncbi:hypothetical protein [Candidatus Mycobacterium methanotrophicum]|uniref:Uncharacterized protein n=1 Tax=Candidatus Mycobacterium methanotrophicum TaxID=2943498 RepID=A0ABY4QQU1_9MYCO|nr:hypothetical protein [Candidatus Mycobacterium methanotrophicum]UQX13385.1 hypothetical protein M5I08_07090 [Candidatus Mycobacterium methanotrophicum]
MPSTRAGTQGSNRRQVALIDRLGELIAGRDVVAAESQSRRALCTPWRPLLRPVKSTTMSWLRAAPANGVRRPR